VDDRGTQSGTALVRLARLGDGAFLYGKAEFMLPSGSAFDRIAGPLLDANKASGVTPQGAVVGGSGSQCLAFAAAAAYRRVPLVVVCPENTLVEHRILLSQYPCTVIASSGAAGMVGARARAEEEAHARGYRLVFPDSRGGAIELFARGVGDELIAQLRPLALPAPVAVVAPVGTGALIAGLERAFLDAQVRAGFFGTVTGEPQDTLQDGVVRQREAPPIPNVKFIEVLDADAAAMRRAAAIQEGLLVGLASAGALHAARGLLRRKEAAAAIAILVDAGDRYFSRDAQPSPAPGTTA
jgi:cysteine synthase A